MTGGDQPAIFSLAWAKEWWGGESTPCPSHLVGRLDEAVAEREFREGRFLALMGVMIGVLSLLVDIVMVPEHFFLIAAVRLSLTLPLQALAIIMPRTKLGWQKFFLGASLILYGLSLIYGSRLAPAGPAVLMALGPIILLGIAIPLLPYTRLQLAIFVAGFVIPISGFASLLAFDQAFLRMLIIVQIIVAAGAAIIALRLRHLERQGALSTILAQDRARKLEESNTRLTQLSMQDPLTDLANRRWTEAAFERDFAASSEEAPGWTTLLLLDLDHFKNFNDQWGHDIGDRCLKAVAEVIRHMANAHCGLAARIGGEEFVILIRAFDQSEALKLAEEVRLGIERIEIPLGNHVQSVSITTSIGIAMHEGLDSPELTILLKRADEALYEAKRDGRNRFKLAR